jgi:hypothetical protein
VGRRVPVARFTGRAVTGEPGTVTRRLRALLDR